MLEERGDAFRGIPKLSCLVLLKYFLGVTRASPSLGSFRSLFLQPSWSHPELENFNHTKLNKTFVRSISIIKQITTLSIVANPFIFYSCIISTVFQLFYGKNSSKKIIESSKQAHKAKKTESVKNRTVCSNLDILNTSVTPKTLKIGMTWAICILMF